MVAIAYRKSALPKVFYEKMNGKFLLDLSEIRIFFTYFESVELKETSSSLWITIHHRRDR